MRDEDPFSYCLISIPRTSVGVIVECECGGGFKAFKASLSPRGSSFLHLPLGSAKFDSISVNLISSQFRASK